MMSALPRSLKMEISPPEPIWTTTTAVLFFPAGGLMFDVPGFVVPVGHNVRKVDAVTLVTVMFMTIAVALAGMPFNDATCHTTVPPCVR
jgi:hypothetical protein